MNDYRISITLETGVRAETEEAAKQHVLKVLADDIRAYATGATIDIGPAGAVLPCDIAGVTAKQIDWSTEPRP